MQVYKAIKYIRLSYTDDKSVESDSVANQRRLIDDFIARHPEIEVVAEKIDDGYSGVLFDRPAFQEMMRMIEQGEANCVIVKDLSRLGREYIETGRYMRRVFPAYGVRFIAMRYNVLTSSAYCRAVGLQYFLRVATHRANVLAAALWADPIASSNVTGYGIAARRCRISVILRLLPLGGHSCRKAASAVGLSIHNMASSMPCR